MKTVRDACLWVFPAALFLPGERLRSVLKINEEIVNYKKNKHLKSIILVAGLVAFAWVNAQAQSLLTPGEEARYRRYSQNEEIARFMSALQARAKEVRIRVVGRTKEVKIFPAQDIYLGIISEEGALMPGELNRDKLTMMLTASQHGNEQSAKEAALWLMRDIAVGELKPLLKKMNFLFMPQTNPYGNWNDVRENETALDMNRDHVKLETAGVRAICRAFRAYMPEATIDVHEKGDDYYRVSIGAVSNLNISNGLLDFSRKDIIPEVEKSLAKKNIAFFEYLVSQEMGLDSSAGVRYEPAELANRERILRFSTTDLNDGRNGPGIYETLSFIQEGASRHDIETLGERTRWQYFGIRSFTESLANHGAEALALVRNLRRQLLEKARVYSDQNIVHLRMDYVRDPGHPTLTLQRYEKTQSPAERGLGILKTDKNAGEIVKAGDLAPISRAGRIKVIEEIVKNWFPNVESRLAVPIPTGYFIPAAHQDVVETLLLHGIEVGLVTQDRPILVEVYTVADIVPSKYDYLPPDRIEVEKKDVQIIARKGDFYVSCAQEAAHLIPNLLEPQSEDGLIRYWKYGLVPEKGEMFAFYRLVRNQDLPLIPYKNWKD